LRYLIIFVLAAFLLKLGAAPFHYWVTDVYEGAPAIVTLFLCIVVNLTMFLALVYLFNSPLFFNTVAIYRPLLSIASILSIVIGCFGAFFQKNIMRILAYSSIYNMGYVLAGLSVGNLIGLQAALTHLVFYCFSFLLLFTLILNCKKEGSPCITYTTDLKNLRVGNMFVPLLFVLTLSSLVGIPPLTGYCTKVSILMQLIYSELYGVATIATFSSVLSGYYYFSLIKIVYSDPEDLPLLFLPNRNSRSF